MGIEKANAARRSYLISADNERRRQLTPEDYAAHKRKQQKTKERKRRFNERVAAGHAPSVENTAKTFAAEKKDIWARLLSGSEVVVYRGRDARKVPGRGNNKGEWGFGIWNWLTKMAEEARRKKFSVVVGRKMAEDGTRFLADYTDKGYERRATWTQSMCVSLDPGWLAARAKSIRRFSKKKERNLAAMW